MKKLEVEITLKSGRTVPIKTNEYNANQFKDWAKDNFTDESGDIYELIVWDNILVNVAEIESIKLVE